MEDRSRKTGSGRGSITAGASKPFIIEEPVAAAIGADMDITQPQVIWWWIWGGTTDIAVLSLGGI